MLHYYWTFSKKEEVNDISSKIIELQYSAQLTVKKISSLGEFDLVNHYKNSKLLEKQVSKYYSLVLDYVNKFSELTKNIDLSKKSLDNTIFELVKDELIADLQPNKIDTDTFSKCVDYAKEVIGKSYTTKITIFSAVLSILGGIVGSLILRFLGI